MTALAHAFRALRRSPGFTLGVALLLGSGIAACTLAYTLFDAILLKQLAVADPQSIVRCVRVLPRLGPRGGFSDAEYDALRRGSTTLQSVAAAWDRNVSYSDGGTPVRARVEFVSDSFFDVFSAPPLMGRTGPVMLSYGFWRDHYGSGQNVIGRKILIQAHPFVIAGVGAPGFNGASLENAPDLWLPLDAVGNVFDKGELRFPNLELYARLQPGASPERAREESVALIARVPDPDNPGFDAVVQPAFQLQAIPRGVSRVRDQLSDAVALALAAVGVLLLMVAANVSGLLLARMAARNREFAVRLALGASPGSLMRLSFATGLLLALFGVAIAVPVCVVAAPALPVLLPPVRLLDTTTVPLALAFAINWRILAFAAGLCAFVTVAVSVAPALFSRRTDIQRVLRGGRTTSQMGARSALIAFQICISTALLVSAIELGSTFRSLRSLDPGFDARRLATFVMDTDLAPSPAQANEAVWRVVEQARSILGVRDTALSNRPLLRGSGMKTTVAPAGKVATKADFMNVSTMSVTPNYFETMGLRFAAGRNYTAGEVRAAPSADEKKATPQPVVVNQAFVDRFFPGTDGVGRAFGFGVGAAAKPERVIVGVVGNAKYRSVREPWEPTVYGIYYTDNTGRFAILHVRAEGSAASVIEPVRELLNRLAPGLPVYEVTTMDRDVESSLATEKVLARLSAAFGAAAAFILAAGLFALLSYVVAQRSREIGIRFALGARSADVVRLLASRLALVCSVGIAGGIALAQVAGRVFASVLYGVGRWDLRALAAAALGVMAVAALAAALPATRAVRIAPASALRDE